MNKLQNVTKEVREIYKEVKKNNLIIKIIAGIYTGLFLLAIVIIGILLP